MPRPGRRNIEASIGRSTVAENHVTFAVRVMTMDVGDIRVAALARRFTNQDGLDFDVPSHRLLVRAGYVRRTAPGIYSWLPLGWMVLRNVERIVRETDLTPAAHLTCVAATREVLLSLRVLVDLLVLLDASAQVEVDQLERDLRGALEHTGNSLAAYIGELEDRFDSSAGKST